MDQRSLTARSIRLFVIRHCLTCLLLAAVSTLSLQTAGAQTILPPGFQDSVVLAGTQRPHSRRLRAGRTRVRRREGGHHQGIRLLGDTAPTVFADLRTEVNDYHDRGLLGLAIDPAFPGVPISMCCTRETRRPAAARRRGDNRAGWRPLSRRDQRLRCHRTPGEAGGRGECMDGSHGRPRRRLDAAVRLTFHRQPCIRTRRSPLRIGGVTARAGSSSTTARADRRSIPLVTHPRVWVA